MPEITSILLVGAENIIALPIIRSLGAVLPDAKIHTFSPSKKSKSVSERSKFISSHHYFNCWKDNLPQKLIEKIAETKADLVLPVSDNAVRLLISNKHELKKLVYLPPLPPLDVYDQLEKKDQMANLLTHHHFQAPKTWDLKDTLPDDLNENDFPLLIKPIDGSSGMGIQKIHHKQHLADIIKGVNKSNYILQEIIPGQDLGCSVLAVDGEIKAYTIQKVLVHKNFGVATAIRFVDHPEVLESTKKLINLTGYSGLAHLDFRLDERDNMPKLIDFNARFWFSLLGSKAAGVDFTLLCCLTATGTAFVRPEYKNIIYLAGINTLRYYMRKVFSPKKAFLPKASVYTDFWDRIGDPMPEVARFIW
ncbi:MAG: ATP-grasp domain-containing protein [Balneolaceae bacterium]